MRRRLKLRQNQIKMSRRPNGRVPGRPRAQLQTFETNNSERRNAAIRGDFHPLAAPAGRPADSWLIAPLTAHYTDGGGGVHHSHHFAFAWQTNVTANHLNVRLQSRCAAPPLKPLEPKPWWIRFKAAPAKDAERTIQPLFVYGGSGVITRRGQWWC